MQSQAVPANQADLTLNKERNALEKLLKKRLEMTERDLKLIDDARKHLDEHADIYRKRIVNTVTNLFMESLPPEITKGETFKSEIDPKDSKRIDLLDTKIADIKVVKKFYDHLDHVIETISKPIRSLLDCKIDNDLTKLNTFYSTQPKLEQDARKAVNNLTDQLTTLQRTPPLPNSPINPEVGKAVAVNSAHVDNLVNCTNALSTLFTRLETACALRAKVKETSFEIESFTIESIKKEAIECSKLRDEFLSLRENQLKDFIVNWKDKITAAKTAATELAKTKDATKAKITALYRPSNQPPREEAKAASPAAVRAC